MTTWTDEQIQEGVREVLEDALGVDEWEIEPEAKLVQDLGAESIDFLEFTYRLEKHFGVKIDQNDLFPSLPDDYVEVSRGPYGEERLERVTQDGVRQLRERASWLSIPPEKTDLTENELFELFTVERLVEFVKATLEERAPQPKEV